MTDLYYQQIRAAFRPTMDVCTALLTAVRGSDLVNDWEFSREELESLRVLRGSIEDLIEAQNLFEKRPGNPPLVDGDPKEVGKASRRSRASSISLIP